ncbi:RimJ/RimL family protein N-acetyltransferase [Rhizobium leguminosarum]|uniref:RimJ/RimL family protein N-acetyltransferase n=1 Tax=Rhizobium leguminosarum TaxID=384 RepID=A0AAE2MER2_RHILE|nr:MULTISPECIES: GNAT family N-acetyltransferase [Rhizobium]MBB4287991.1 RimJ/RimL family protein N-acetyltransferase [Rhizobium leguminosarum]MBB4295918.1 RimJ/RimL family protein N-acetyltransferase [Rhizobium leguminosarum]MBB4307310.1 RimJ/RimL family protein N-acetyltransferase [Rhizobium leguminosarum]MBB4417107.1 RimJ/RimL family protein N-acetyltransferase [Rhizobium leguminosarum]MBB4431951.1 RimJ/RimL family protein N-acetyltransferase [Rhizobium esperanzae]
MTQVDIVSLKDNADPARRLRLPIRDDTGRHVGDLQCIDRSMLDEPGLIDDLTTWRSQSMPFFLTQFSAVEERTRRWLETISLPAADRILFVICDPDGNRFGNFGICNIQPGSADFDNVIRGRASGIRNLMFHCGRALLEWMFSGLGVETAELHVFSHNEKAIGLYKRLGFAPAESLPLRRTEEEGMVKYSIVDRSEANAGFDYLRMELPIERFRQAYPAALLTA